MDLQTMAWRLLSPRSPTKERARLCRLPLSLHRDQRHLLLPPTPVKLRHLGRADPRGLRLLHQASRYITHMLKLRNAEQALANFFASGLLALGQKLGPILWQFPPNFQFNAARLEDFFALLPRDTHAAAAIAQGHDERLKGRAYTAPGRKHLIRHAMEIRHPSFVTPDFVALLRRHSIALVCADTVEWPLLMDVTSDFLYCRLHGSEVLYTSGYGDQALDQWAARIATWACGGEVPGGYHASPKPARQRPARDVYIYFDNDAKVHAPKDAQALIKRITQLLTPTNGRTDAPHSHKRDTQVTK